MLVVVAPYVKSSCLCPTLPSLATNARNRLILTPPQARACCTWMPDSEMCMHVRGEACWAATFSPCLFRPAGRVMPVLACSPCLLLLALVFFNRWGFNKQAARQIPPANVLNHPCIVRSLSLSLSLPACLPLPIAFPLFRTSTSDSSEMLHKNTPRERAREREMERARERASERAREREFV